jgi:hypothetical protein
VTFAARGSIGKVSAGLGASNILRIPDLNALLRLAVDQWGLLRLPRGMGLLPFRSMLGYPRTQDGTGTSFARWAQEDSLASRNMRCGSALRCKHISAGSRSDNRLSVPPSGPLRITRFVTAVPRTGEHSARGSWASVGTERRSRRWPRITCSHPPGPGQGSLAPAMRRDYRPYYLVHFGCIAWCIKWQWPGDGAVAVGQRFAATSGAEEVCEVLFERKKTLNGAPRSAADRSVPSSQPAHPYQLSSQQRSKRQSASKWLALSVTMALCVLGFPGLASGSSRARKSRSGSLLLTLPARSGPRRLRTQPARRAPWTRRARRRPCSGLTLWGQSTSWGHPGSPRG